MVDWISGQPNARFWVLKLLHDNFGPGDKLVDTSFDSSYVYAQAFETRDGKRKLLLINKRNRPFEVSTPASQGSNVTYVDQTTSSQPPASAQVGATPLTLSGYEVAVVTM